MRQELAVRECSWEELRPYWNTIAEASARATVFQTWDWIYPYWKHGLVSGKPLLLGFFAGEECVGIAPFAAVWGGFRLKRLTLIGGDYCDILALDAWSESVVAALVQWLEANRSRWNFADLKNLRANALARELVSSESRFMVAETVHQVYPATALPKSWDDFLASLGKKMRWQLRYYPKKLQKECGDTIIRLANEASLEADMQVLFDLHQQRWTERGMPGVFEQQYVRDLHLDVARGLLSRGRLKLYTLWVGTTPAAAFYCLEHGSDICYYLGGFDTSLAKFRPLKGLMGHAIQDAIGNGRELLDFLKGEEQYKTEWRAENRSTYRVLLAPAGVRQWFVMSSLKLQPKVKDMQRRRRQRAVTQHTAEDSTEE